MQVVLYGVKGRRNVLTWLYIMLGISVAYILAELAFNAALLNFVSGRTSNPNDYHNIEYAGRLLSSFGFSLMVFGLLGINRRVLEERSWKLGFKRLLITTVLAGPCFYYGSHYVIEKTLIEPSTVNARVLLNRADLFRRAEAVGIADIYGGGAKSYSQANEPDRMAYFAISPMAFMLDFDLMKTTTDKKTMEGMINKYISWKFRQHMEEAYPTYLEQEDRLAKFASDYQKASDAFFESYQPPVTEAQFTKLWNYLSPDIDRWWRDANRRAIKLRRQGEKYSDIDNMNVRDMLTKADYYADLGTLSRVARRINRVQSGPNVLSTDLLGFDGTRQSLHDCIFAIGFDKATKVWRSQATKEVDAPANALANLKPGMSFSEIMKDENIAQWVRSETGGLYSDQLRPGMTHRELNLAYVDMATNMLNKTLSGYRLTNRYLPTAEANTAEMDIYQSIVIAPIALALSLFFSLVALLKLPVMVYQIQRVHRDGGHDDYSKKWINFAKLVMIAAIMIVPVKLTTDATLPSWSVKATHNITESFGTMAGHTARWMLAVEPKLYVAGQAVLNITHLDNRDPKSFYHPYRG